MNAYNSPSVAGRALITRRSGLLIALAVLVPLAMLGAFLIRPGSAGCRFIHFRTQARAYALRSVLAQSRVSINWGDRFGDGTPDFLRLADPADRAAFRRWFTLIAEFQSARRQSEVPPEITDCASLLRYSYREALKRHDDSWYQSSGIEVPAPPGEIGAWSYPHTPLGTELFRVRDGAFDSADISNGAFAQFADAKTLVEHNAYLLGRDVRAALPGDLLFYRQFGQSSPWHSMIVLGTGTNAEVVYDTGPDHGHPGEIRRVLLSELLNHPQPQWRPLPGNPNFLGVYRWNILRGTP